MSFLDLIPRHSSSSPHPTVSLLSVCPTFPLLPLRFLPEESLRSPVLPTRDRVLVSSTCPPLTGTSLQIPYVPSPTIHSLVIRHPPSHSPFQSFMSPSSNLTPTPTDLLTYYRSRVPGVVTPFSVISRTVSSPPTLSTRPTVLPFVGYLTPYFFVGRLFRSSVTGTLVRLPLEVTNGNNGR